jgi:hypothetical protein
VGAGAVERVVVPDPRLGRDRGEEEPIATDRIEGTRVPDLAHVIGVEEIRQDCT